MAKDSKPAASTKTVVAAGRRIDGKMSAQVHPRIQAPKK